jgi:hypothetical protein
MTDAVKAYREAVHDDTLTKWDIIGYADAAIAELEAEVERLKKRLAVLDDLDYDPELDSITLHRDGWQPREEES